MKQVWQTILAMRLILASANTPINMPLVLPIITPVVSPIIMPIIISTLVFVLSATSINSVMAVESADGASGSIKGNVDGSASASGNINSSDSNSNTAIPDLPQVSVARFLKKPNLQDAITEGGKSNKLLAQAETYTNPEPVSVTLPDPFGRDTPRGTVEGFLKALSEHDNELASKYLQLTKYDNPIDEVRLLNKALDSGGRLLSDIQIDDTNGGNLTDNLPANVDNVGTISFDGEKVDIQLVHVPNAKGYPIWLFSQQTLQKLPTILAHIQPTLVEKYNIEVLEEIKFFNFYVNDMVAVAIIGLVTFALIYLLIWLLYLLINFLYPRISNRQLPITDNIILPLVVMLASVLLPEMLVWAGVSVTIREPVTSIVGIFAWAPLIWLLVRVSDTIFKRVEKHSKQHKRLEQIAIIHLIRKLIKATLIIIAVIVIFGNLGFDLTTGIATLGIGGLALALGAQKTVENLVGSVVVVADQPVRVGDYCRFGEQTGFVVDIGIRSSRIQTLDRTFVTVPNGDFSSMQIENITARDMFSVVENLYLKRTANPKVIHNLLRELDTFLNEHYLTNQEWNQVRIAELRQDCFVIECRAYVNANDMKEFFDKQNVILIDLLKEVEKYDVEHALPMQELVLGIGS